MLTSIFQNLTEGLSGMLDAMIRVFMEALNLDLSEYLVIFPYLATVYSILQGIAIGLTAVIAGRHLAMFGLGSVDTGNLQDRPVNILLRSAIAGAAIYFGGYVLEFVVYLGKIPFEIFLNSDSTVDGIAGTLADGASIFANSEGVKITDFAVALIGFFFVIMIAWNVFKLAVEVCERFVMVGILVFTSPIVYPTIATKETSQIFKRWCGMFVSSLIMMSASILFLKLVVNGLGNALSGAGESLTPGVFLVRLLTIVATCKIAQRVDTYLGQLGLTTAVTGGSLVDDMLAIAGTMRRIGHTAKGAVLGAGHIAGAVASRSAVGRGVASGIEAFRSGNKSVRESFAAGKAAIAENLKKDTAVGRAVTAGAAAHKANKTAAPGDKKSVVAAAAGGAAVGAARHAGYFVAPKTMAGHDNKLPEQKEKQAREAAQKARDEKQEAAQKAREEKQEAAQKAREEKQEAAQKAREEKYEATQKAREEKQEAAQKAREEKQTKEKAASMAASASRIASQDNQRAAQKEQADKKVGHNPLPENIKKDVAAGKPFSASAAAQNRENYGVTGDKGNAFDVDASSGDSASVGLTPQAAAAGLSMAMDDDGKSKVTGNEKSLGAWENEAATQFGRVPDETGADRIGDESLGSSAMQEQMRNADRFEYAAEAHGITNSTIDGSSAETVEAALNGHKALSGTREMAEMADAAAAPISPQGEKESDADYGARYASESSAKAAKISEMASTPGFNPYAVKMAEKAFGDALPAGSKITGYQAVDHSSFNDSHGNTFNGGRSHMVSYQDSNGDNHTVEIMTGSRYTSLPPEQKSTGVDVYKSASGSNYYVRDVSDSYSHPVGSSERIPVDSQSVTPTYTQTADHGSSPAPSAGRAESAPVSTPEHFEQPASNYSAPQAPAQDRTPAPEIRPSYESPRTETQSSPAPTAQSTPTQEPIRESTTVHQETVRTETKQVERIEVPVRTENRSNSSPVRVNTRSDKDSRSGNNQSGGNGPNMPPRAKRKKK